MSERNLQLLIEDIIEAIDKVKGFVKGMNFQQFKEDVKTQDAVYRNFEVMGEAANKITEETKLKYQEVEWNKIIGLRNRIIHHYFGIDNEIIWNIIQNNLDLFREQLSKIVISD